MLSYCVDVVGRKVVIGGAKSKVRGLDLFRTKINGSRAGPASVARGAKLTPPFSTARFD